MSKKRDFQYTVVCPLEFFSVRREVPLDELDLGSHILIRKIARDEEKVLQKHVSHKLFPGYRDLCLEVKAENVRPALEALHSVVSSLRLLKPSIVGINFYLIHDVPTDGEIEILALHAPMEIFWSPWGPKRESYRFGNEDIKVFNQLYKNCKETILKNNKFKFAIARFNQSYSANFEDKLLDWMITLEALFITGESKKSFNLKMRISKFLGKNPNEEKDIESKIKTAYQLRNALVHEGQFLPRIIKIKDEKLLRQVFMDRIEELTRTSLRKYLEWTMQNKTLDFHKTLDRAVFSISERNKLV